MVRLQQHPIRVEDLVQSVHGPSQGAVALFLGTVRDHNAGRRVLHLEYQAYPAMAAAEMERIRVEAIDSFGVPAVAIVHRTGRLEIGEVAVAVAVASPHRAQALEACRFVIDRLKETVPIWKREVFEDGAVWIEGAGESPSDAVLSPDPSPPSDPPRSPGSGPARGRGSS